MAWDPVWEKIFASRSWGRYPGEELVRFVARNFYDAPDRAAVKFLELGCGPGPNLWFLAREGFTAYGIDGSPSALSQARARLNQEVPNWHGALVQGELLHLPFPDNSFDALIDNEAVSCNSFEDACQIYAEARRVLKPGGKLFVRTFATGCWGECTGTPAGHNAWFVSEGPLAGEGIARFTREEDISLLLDEFESVEHAKLELIRNPGKFSIKEWLITAITSKAPVLTSLRFTKTNR
ncbi:MAG TPA: methyltransferase domain-containing protein [Candidatus Ozemobacteraceae bacterium]|nr:methyltransferase domain-containing protein [Candidatus Ozemobacteraceae bacterium]